MPKLTHRRHRIGSLQASRPTTLRTLHFGTIRECEIPGMLYMNLTQTLHDAVPELEKLKIALKQKCARQERVRLSKEALQFPIHACGSRGEGHARSAGQNLCVMSSSSLAPMALAAALSSKDGEHSRGCLTAVEGHAGVGYRTIPWWQDVRAAGAELNSLCCQFRPCHLYRKHASYSPPDVGFSAAGMPSHTGSIAAPDSDTCAPTANGNTRQNSAVLFRQPL